jgi:tetratricopeptide (TPR) repeat protein
MNKYVRLLFTGFLIALAQLLYAQTSIELAKMATIKEGGNDNEGAIELCTRALQLDSKNAFALNVRGVAKYNLGRYEEAITDFDQAVAINLGYESAYHNRGLAKNNLGRYADAIADFNKAIDLSPKSVSYYINRSVSRINLNQYKDAIQDNSTAIMFDPKNAVAYDYRGYAYFKLGDTKTNYKKSIADYDKSVALGGRGYTPFYKYRAEAMQRITDIENFAKTLTAKYWIDSALLKQQLNEDEAAIVYLDHALRIEPLNTWALNLRGTAKFNLGRYEDAIADYSQAIAVNPGYKALYGNRALAKHKLGFYGGAIADYSKALALDPNSTDLYINRSVAEIGLEQYKQAIVDNQKAISLNPRLPIPYNYRGYAYFKLGESKANYQAAVADYDKAIQVGGPGYDPYYKYRDDALQKLSELTPKVATLTAQDLVNRAVEKESQGDNNGALADCSKALQLEPDNTWALNVRGIAKFNLAQYAEAIKDYNQAIKLDEGYKSAYRNRALAQDKLARYADAIADYDRLLALDPQNGDALGNRGADKVRMGRYADALADLNLTISINPANADAFNNRGYAYFKIGGSNANFQAAVQDYDKSLEIAGPSYHPAYKYRENALAALAKNNNATDSVSVTLAWGNSPSATKVLPDGSYQAENAAFPLLLKITSGKPITNEKLKLLLNGQDLAKSNNLHSLIIKQLVNKQTPGKFSYELSATVDLPNGNSTLLAKYDLFSAAPLQVTYQPKVLNLYVLSIGTNNSLSFAKKDAIDFAQMFKQPSLKRYFGTVVTDTLTGQNASARNIAQKIAAFGNKQFHDNDVLLVFISSHGMVDENKNKEFRVVGSDFNNLNIAETSVDFKNQIYNPLKKLPCKKFLFLDACYSGSSLVLGAGLNGAPKAKNVDIDIEVKKLINASDSLTIITSSSNTEKSWEDPAWKNGAFTKALKEAMQDGKADKNNNGIIDMNELFAYVSWRVPELVKQENEIDYKTHNPVTQTPAIKNPKGDVSIYVY